ncbi:hypothetical protein D3C81_1978200 [compost metagenome]
MAPVDRGGRDVGIGRQVNVIRLRKRLERARRRSRDGVMPLADHFHLEIHAARVGDPAVSLARDPIDRLLAVAGYDERHASGNRLGDQVRVMQRAVRAVDL